MQQKKDKEYTSQLTDLTIRAGKKSAGMLAENMQHKWETAKNFFSFGNMAAVGQQKRVGDSEDNQPLLFDR